MNKRPISVTALSSLFIAVGVVGLAHHLTELNLEDPFRSELFWIFLICLTAIVCGVYMLRGRSWARWLALAWIAFHVAVSALHSWHQFIVHGLLLAVVAYVLFRPEVRAYFRSGRAEAT